MQIHHLAIVTRNPERLAAFYAELLGVGPTRRLPEAGEVRAIWFDLEGAILMIERGESAAGGHVLVFRAAPGSYAAWSAKLASTERTEFTVYGRDPDGNRVGVSSYPEALGS